MPSNIRLTSVENDAQMDLMLIRLYINDLAEVSDTLHTVSFADETTVTMEGKHEAEHINILNTELQKLNCWL